MRGSSRPVTPTIRARPNRSQFLTVLAGHSIGKNSWRGRSREAGIKRRSFTRRPSIPVRQPRNGTLAWVQRDKKEGRKGRESNGGSTDRTLRTGNRNRHARGRASSLPRGEEEVIRKRREKGESERKRGVSRGNLVWEAVLVRPCFDSPADITSGHMSWLRQHASVCLNRPSSFGLDDTLPCPHHNVPDATNKHEKNVKSVKRRSARSLLDISHYTLSYLGILCVLPTRYPRSYP